MQQRELIISETRERSQAPRRAILPGLAALAAAALAAYAYRDLFARPFAADDYQWLVAVRDLSFGEVARRAFDAGAQSHFYRPLVWLLFWAQGRAFGLDPRGYHVVSLALHLLNAGLLGWLSYRLLNRHRSKIDDQRSILAPSAFGLSSALLAGLIALHPAPFEAVTWVSAQSELIAAALLLAALHFWLPRQGDKETRRQTENRSGLRVSLSPRLLAATLALGLALLAKESAAIGLPLLMLLGWPTDDRNSNAVDRKERLPSYADLAARLAPYALPALVTLAYVALQVAVERRNYLLAQGGYGLGPQIILNPLRSLALIVAPLPGTEHADAAWLAPAGAVVALFIMAWVFDLGSRRDSRATFKTHNSKLSIALALALTLLPTAPFVSPPDSRYLYLPVMAGAIALIWLVMIPRLKTNDQRPKTGDQEPGHASSHGPWSLVERRWAWPLALGCALALAWWASGELHAREGRFAAAAGPGGSLWRLAGETCAAGRPDRVVVVEPPIAPPHVEAIVKLACGAKVKTKIVGRDQVDAAIKGRSIVIDFPGGSAQIVRKT